MCIISIKKPNVKMPGNKIIRRMFSANPDGAGFMIHRSGDDKISLHKGYMDVKSFLSAIKSADIREKDTAVLHFRIATSGLINDKNCHPFVVSESLNIIQAPQITTSRMCMAHNGQITELDGVHKKLNDTTLFIRDYVADPIIYDNLYDNIVLQELIAEYVNGSRLSFLHPKNGLLLMGTWHEHDGVLYSNTGYKKPKQQNISWKSYNTDYLNDFAYCESCGMYRYIYNRELCYYCDSDKSKSQNKSCSL